MSRQSVLLAGLAAVLVTALWWLFLYAPGQDEIAQVEEEIAAAEAETVSLQTRVAALEAIRARAPETEAAIAQVSSIVPDEPALPGALRQVQAAADDAGVEILEISVSRPVAIDEPVGLYSSAVAMNLSASYFQIVDFLRRLEDPAITARGFAFNNLTLTIADYPALSTTLTGQMFAILETPPEPPSETPEAPSEEATEADETGETDGAGEDGA